ncbi:MAG: HAD family hydrolase [Clostridiaceae bacterium]|nr:HAD family hydrolase [Clostridiaceae bacterium]
MERLIDPMRRTRPLKAILFDFDGTLSTLRCGWETVMAALMRELLGGPEHDPALERQIDAYIDASTGIQTIFQMQWLAGQVRARGHEPLDPWAYKAIYNDRLMQTVARRRDAVLRGDEPPERYLVAGSRAFLEALSRQNVALFVASGTDQADVAAEAKILGLAGFFNEIAGALPGQASCSKEALLRRLVQAHGLGGDELAVIGDGKVEIGIAREAGARSLGVASDEIRLSGVNLVKRKRLVAAGAQAIVGDFLEPDAILDWLLR